MSPNIVLNRSECTGAKKSEKQVFDRALAFSRTLGLVTPDELDTLHRKTIAIAGLGGVGGSHLLTLTRLGVGGFHLADFDTFGQENFNRQAGANMTTIGRRKLDVMIELARQINPGLRIKSFPAGVSLRNVDEFLHGADIYVDGLDLFAFQVRDAVFQTCYEAAHSGAHCGSARNGRRADDFPARRHELSRIHRLAGHRQRCGESYQISGGVGAGAAASLFAGRPAIRGPGKQEGTFCSDGLRTLCWICGKPGSEDTARPRSNPGMPPFSAFRCLS